jgi:hypothetical protein
MDNRWTPILWECHGMSTLIFFMEEFYETIF